MEIHENFESQPSMTERVPRRNLRVQSRSTHRNVCGATGLGIVGH